MKRILFIALLSSLLHTTVHAQDTSGANNQSPPVVVNGIAVVVNNEVVTKQELDDRVRMIEQRLKAQGMAIPPYAELRRQVIERMIVDRAQLQLARDTGLRVDDAMLDRAMSRMAEQNKMSLQTFRDQVEKEGMSYAQFRENVREEIMLQRIAEREVGSKVQVSESEIDDYLLAQNKNKQNNQAFVKQAGQPNGQQITEGVQQAHVRHILIKVTPTMTKDQAIHKLREFKQRIESGGARFEDIATQFSNDTAAKGGDLGWIYPGDVAEFDQTISQLKEGEISAPLETPYGMHIIQLVERKTDEVSPERQRLSARQAIRARKAEEATLDWARQLRDSAYVEIRDN